MKTNNLARIAERFIEACGNIQMPDKPQVFDLMPVLKNLEHLKFDQSYAYECITPGIVGMGGETRIYAYPKGGIRPEFGDLPDVHMIGGYMEDEEDGEPCLCEYDITAHVTVDGSPESVWEYHLLTQMWRFLPLWWHANYALRKYITDADSLMSIANTDPFHTGEEQEIEKTDVILTRSGFSSESESDKIVALNGDRCLLPSVSYEDDRYEITYSYWSEWGGLSRVRLFATVENGITLFIGEPKEICLAFFDCGILF